MDADVRYMNRCIELGKLALGTARPNPMVGCVIVHDKQIIGEGFTSPFGGPHAEVNAIKSVEDISLLAKSTLYVSLEPCSHFGKTPPCAHLIIESGIRRVVIGCMDPNPKVSGNGIKVLKSAGCEVTTGVLEQECRDHFKRFLTLHEKNRPYIILKWAQTINGFIAPRTRDKTEPVWISNPVSRQLVHKWRSEEQAILVGYNTVKDDNPSLTTRDWEGNNPIKIILTRNNDLDKSLNIFINDPPFIIDGSMINFDQAVADQICNILYQKDINSVLVEGGAKTLNHFIESGLWDEARVFVGSTKIIDGLQAPLIKMEPIEEHDISGDRLLIYKND